MQIITLMRAIGLLLVNKVEDVGGVLDRGVVVGVIHVQLILFKTLEATRIQISCKRMVLLEVEVYFCLFISKKHVF